MMSTTETSGAYEVKLSPRGFDVLCVDGHQAVYFSHSRSAARMVSDALNGGRIEAKQAVRLPEGVADVRTALSELVE